MRTLKTLTAILALVLCTTSLAFAAPYPAEVPKDFEKAPKQFICERETPTAVHINAYENTEAQKWSFVRTGKNKEDFLLDITAADTNGNETRTYFLATDNGWRGLSQKEFDAIKFEDFYSLEELIYLFGCLGGFLAS